MLMSAADEKTIYSVSTCAENAPPDSLKNVLVAAGPAAIAPLPGMREVRGNLRPPLQDDRHLHRGEKPLPLLVVSVCYTYEPS